jgi:hypothetical protein
MQAAWELQIQVIQEDFLVIAGLGDVACAELAAVFCRQDDVDRTEFAEFRKHAPRFVAEAGLLAELAQELPEHICQEADQNVGPHTILFVVPHGPDG